MKKKAQNNKLSSKSKEKNKSLNKKKIIFISIVVFFILVVTIVISIAVPLSLKYSTHSHKKDVIEKNLDANTYLDFAPSSSYRFSFGTDPDETFFTNFLLYYQLDDPTKVFSKTSLDLNKTENQYSLSYSLQDTKFQPDKHVWGNTIAAGYLIPKPKQKYNIKNFSTVFNDITKYPKPLPTSKKGTIFRIVENSQKYGNYYCDISILDLPFKNGIRIYVTLNTTYFNTKKNGFDLNITNENGKVIKSLPYIKVT